MRLVFDIETDNLKIQDITKIHCICIIDVDTGKEQSFYDYPDMSGNNSPIRMGVAYLKHASEIIGHNIIGYDLQVIQKFFPQFKPKKVTDTLVLARLFEPDRKVHSLESYGNTVGTQKVKHEDWSTFSPEMLNRCKTDVQINLKLYRYFMSIKQEYPNWNFAIQLEHEVAKIMAEQAANGWLFDKEKAKKLVEKLDKDIAEIDEQLEPLLHKRIVKISEVKKPFKKNGQLTEQCKKYIDFPIPISATSYPLGQYLEVVGSFSVIEFQGINLGSEKQMKELLLSLGWKPTTWNYKKKNKKFIRDKNGELIKTSPKLTEDSYDSLPEGVGQLLAKRLKCLHRLKQLKGNPEKPGTGLIPQVRADGRIPAKADPCGTNTGRMTHRVVVNIPKAAPNVFLGKEMRSLFIVPEGKTLVGCDASGLEWRIAAHYLRSKKVIDLVLTGDIHSFIGSLANVKDRDLAKRTGYGILYGASDKRVAQILGTDIAEGARVRNAIIQGLPGLSDLLKKIDHHCKNKFLPGIDGRKIFIRSKHSALNALFQSAGAIVMKMAMYIAYKEIKKNNLNAKQIGCFHDELQYECDAKDAEKLAKMIKFAIIQSGKYFKMRCELNAESKQGINWAETH